MPQEELRNAVDALMETDARYFRDKEGDRGDADIDVHRVDGGELDRRGEIQAGKQIGEASQPRQTHQQDEARA
ncbi:MAG: hypothetical protein E6I86_16665 [Chloroflexi bacterium]|nr:MAG: hypothetical protein E6I86_16665 [Chloroflexota bacterium]